MLTCNPGRVAANQMYQRMGFELRKTNVYRFRLSNSEPLKTNDDLDN